MIREFKERQAGNISYYFYNQIILTYLVILFTTFSLQGKVAQEFDPAVFS